MADLELLLATDRPEPAEPSLLGWLAAHCALADLSTAVALAASAGELTPHMGWPVIEDAVIEVAAARRAAREPRIGELPAGPVSAAAILRRLGRQPGSPLQELTDEELAYLLPALPKPSADTLRRSVEAVEQAVHAEAWWYATAIAARVAPQLDDETRSRVATLANRLPERWGSRLTELTRVRTPWPSAATELEASHPSLPAANEAAAALGDAAVTEICHRTIAHLAERYPPGPDVPWAFPVRPPEEAYAEPPAAGHPGATTEMRGPLGDDAPRHWTAGTGMARKQDPLTPLTRKHCLEPATEYWFWFEIGRKAPDGSIVDVPVPIVLPAGVLTVALFGYHGQIEVVDGRDTGLVRLDAGSGITVLRRPAGSPVNGTRLFFPIRTPARPGRYRLRCHLYYRQTLLQSQLVEVQVEHNAPTRVDALTAQIDYTSAIALPQDLADVQPLTLSVFVNENGDGSHTFRFFGGEEFKSDVVLGEGDLQTFIEATRGALRKASWGKADPKTSGPPFRYHGWTPRDYAEDLINLACKGYRLWAAVAGAFAEPLFAGDDEAPIVQLQNRMRKPGVIEVASRVSARLVVPAALFYDYPLDSGLSLHLCEDAKTALERGDDLASRPCFQGECPSYDEESVVCPGGFWGYRHQIGLPQSTAPATKTVPPSRAHGGHYIEYTNQPRCIVAIATDLSGSHPNNVRMRYHGEIYDDRTKLLRQLRGKDIPQLLYFFCHGDVANDIPVLRIGDAAAPPIAFENFANGRMYWPRSRPLVFLNGCRTAAVEPRCAMNFVDAFIRTACASGMIGTEIVTYEELAAEFADSMLDHFMGKHSSIAQAMRAARLQLLSRRNPLGLIYVAYAPPQLRMRQAGSTAGAQCLT